MYNLTLKAAIQAAINTPADPKISGSILQQKLLEIISAIDAGAVFKGAATPASSPSGESNCFYLASTEGTYTNFLDTNGNAIVLADGEVALLASIYNNDVLRWTKNLVPGRGENSYLHIMYAATEPTQDRDMHPVFQQATDKYIGICADANDTAPDKYDAYQWAKFVGDNGAPGADGHNPNCGTYTNIADAPATGQDGDYIVLVSGDPAKGIIYKWDATANDNAGGWVSTGAEANEAEFPTGQKVIETPIDDTHLVNPASGALAKAEDAMNLLQKLRGVDLEETNLSFTRGDGYINGSSGVITGSGTNYHAEISLSNCEKIRFLGISVNALATATLKEFGYSFYDSNNTPIEGTSKLYKHSSIQDANAPLEEYILTVPENASKFMCSLAATNRQNFYCYAENGHTVIDLIPEIVDNLDSDDAKKALSAKQGKLLHIAITFTEEKIIEPYSIPELNYILYSDGNVNIQYPNWGRTIYNNINPSKKYLATLSVMAGNSTCGVQYFGSGSSFLGCEFLGSAILEDTHYTDVELHIPTGCTYIRMQYDTTLVGGNVLKEVVETSIKEKISETQNNIDDVNDRVDDVNGKIGDIIVEKTNGSFAAWHPDNENNGYYKYDTQAWYAPANINSIISARTEIPENYEYVIFPGFVSRVKTGVSYAFLDNNSQPIQGTIVAYDFDINLSVVGTKDYIVPIPSNAKYFVFVIKRSDINWDITNTGYVCYQKGMNVKQSLDDLNKKITEDTDYASIGITHLKPDNIGQLNTVRRMRKLMDIKWIPSFDFARGASGGGVGFFSDIFKKDKEYSGIPYARALYKRTAYGYGNNLSIGDSGFKIGLTISLDTYVTALSNRGTVLEVESIYDKGSHNASFYANVCAGSVSAALGTGYIETIYFDNGDVVFGGVSFANAPNQGDIYTVGKTGGGTYSLWVASVDTTNNKIHFISAEENYAEIDVSLISQSGQLTKISGVGDSSIAYTNVAAGTKRSGFTYLSGRISPDFNLSLLKLGDVLVKCGVHTTMITDVVVENDIVKYVEISESTTQGNANYDIKGYRLGGLGRRLWWTPEEIADVWGGYKVVRYNSIDNINYTPSPYAPMPDENYGYVPYTMACLPYMGNKFRFNSSVMPDDIRKIVVEVTGKDKLHILKKNEITGLFEDYGNLIDIDYTDYNADTHPYVYVQLPNDMPIGEYKAYVCKYNDGVESEKSQTCQFSVVSSITILADY